MVAAGCATLAGCSGDGGDGSDDPTSTSTATPPSTASDGRDDDGSSTPTDTPQSVSVESGAIDSGPLPGYASVIPAFDGPVALTAFDTEIDAPGDMGPSGGMGGGLDWPDPSDPLRFNALYGYQGGRVAASALLAYPFGVVVSNNFERMAQRGISPQYITLNGVGLVYGSFAFDDAVATLRDRGLTEERVTGDRAFFRTSEGVPVGLTDEVVAFDVSGDHSLSFDPSVRIRRVLDTAIGESPSLASSDEGFARLLWNAGTRNTTSLAYAPETGLDAYLATETGSPLFYDAAVSGFETASGAAFGADLTPDGSTPSTTGLIAYSSGDAVDEGALTTTLGTAATDRSFRRDGTFLRATGTYEWSAFEQFLS